MFDDIDTELQDRLNTLTRELEDRIAQVVSTDDFLVEISIVLRSSPEPAMVAHGS